MPTYNASVISSKENESLSYFGFLCKLCLLSGRAASADLLLTYNHAVKAGTFVIDLSDGKGLPAAVVWGELSWESAAIYLKAGVPPRFAHEYKEGEIVVVFDVMCPSRSIGKMLRLLKCLPAERPVIYRRRGRPNLIFWMDGRRGYRTCGVGGNNEEFGGKAAALLLA